MIARKKTPRVKFFPQKPDVETLARHVAFLRVGVACGNKDIES